MLFKIFEHIEEGLENIAKTVVWLGISEERIENARTGLLPIIVITSFLYMILLLIIL